MEPAVLTRVASAVALTLVLFAAVTWWALESGGVAVVVTHGPDGSVHSAHVWYVEREGELWLEAGSPESSWFLDILGDPDIDFTTDDDSRRYTARVVDEPGAQAEVRALVRNKYGIRDRWISVLVESSRSVPVRLEPIEPAGSRPERPPVRSQTEH